MGLGLPVSVGIGNRGTDIEAYSQVGVEGSRTFIKLPEFASDVEDSIENGDAVGVNNYNDVISVFGTF